MAVIQCSRSWCRRASDPETPSSAPQTSLSPSSHPPHLQRQLHFPKIAGGSAGTDLAGQWAIYDRFTSRGRHLAAPFPSKRSLAPNPDLRKLVCCSGKTAAAIDCRGSLSRVDVTIVDFDGVTYCARCEPTPPGCYYSDGIHPNEFPQTRPRPFPTLTPHFTLHFPEGPEPQPQAGVLEPLTAVRVACRGEGDALTIFFAMHGAPIHLPPSAGPPLVLGLSLSFYPGPRV